MRGSLALGEAVPGLSDVDLVVVVEADEGAPAAADHRVSGRWRRLARRLPLLGRLASVTVYEQPELDDAVRGPAPTYRLDDGASLFYDRMELDDPLWLRTRPGLSGPTADWKLLAGPERRPPAVRRERQDERIAAWLELGWWWRHVIVACREPVRPYTANVLAKALAEAARIVAWFEAGERPSSRRMALAAVAGLGRPSDAERRALAEARSALETISTPGFEAIVPGLADLSARVARAIDRELAPAGYREVRLIGSPGDRRSVPAADWRAVVIGEAPRALALVPGEPADPVAIGNAAGAAGAGELAALRGGDLLLIAPERVWADGYLRTLACPLTDPVSFALLDGAERARFPDVRGWSVEDLARRALAEQRARLRTPAAGPADALAGAIAAGRAALLAQSLQDGEAELRLDPPAVLEGLEALDAAVARPAAQIRSRTADGPMQMPDQLDSPTAGAAQALRVAVAALLPPRS